MNYLDIMIIVVLGLGLFLGWLNGFISEVATLLALVLGVWGAIALSEYMQQFISNWWSNPHLPAISFAVTFVIIIVLVFVLAMVLNKMVEKSALSIPNRIFGSLMSALKFAFGFSVIIAVLNTFSDDKQFFSPQTQKESYCYPYISMISTKVFPYLEFDVIRKSVEKSEVLKSK